MSQDAACRSFYALLRNNVQKYQSNQGDNTLKPYLYFIPLLLCISLISACGSKKSSSPPTPDYPYGKDEITIRFKSSPLLNFNKNDPTAPHTLMVCLYQLRNKSMFEQLSDNEDGIYQLLDCEAYNSSVNTVKRIYIQPKQDLNVVMNRLAGTRYLGVVAGYYVLEKERMVRTIDIPIDVVEHSKIPALMKKESAHASKLNLVINLGSEQIAAIQKY